MFRLQNECEDIMALSRFFRDNKVLKSKASVTVRNVSRPDTGPKNGPMIVGVVSTILIMIALTFINIRLLSAPTPPNEPVSQSVQNKKLNPVLPEMNAAKTEQKACQAPTEVTFYSQLKTKEEKSPGGLSGASAESKTVSTRTSDKSNQDVSRFGPKEEKNFAQPASAGHPGSVPPDIDPKSALSVEKAGDVLSKSFIVQVGAFSHPRIAQEWASKWKAKGYKVTLKPVARPSSGIIYRLYLGDFESEKKADEFVRQLKAKEGISAMRLNARD